MGFSIPIYNQLINDGATSHGYRHAIIDARQMEQWVIPLVFVQMRKQLESICLFRILVNSCRRRKEPSTVHSSRRKNVSVVMSSMNISYDFGGFSLLFFGTKTTAVAASDTCPVNLEVASPSSFSAASFFSRNFAASSNFERLVLQDDLQSLAPMDQEFSFVLR